MKYFVSALFSYFLFLGNIQAEKKIPDLWGPVIDDVHLLNPGESGQLERQIRAYLPKVQMQVWITDSLEGEAIESVSIRAVEKWKLGDAKLDNGILLLIAIKDRAVRIEVGQGLEGDIPDAYAGRVIDYLLVPAFRNRSYVTGISEALSNLYQKIENPQLAAPSSKKKLNGDQIFYMLILLFVFGSFGLSLFLSMFGSKLGIKPRGRSTYWGGGSSWGGGGFGGGGWSGGGGGFSGGGASGRW